MRINQCNNKLSKETFIGKETLMNRIRTLEPLIHCRRTLWALLLATICSLCFTSTIFAQETVYLPLVANAGQIDGTAEEQNPAETERYSSTRGELKTIQLEEGELTYEVIDGLAIYQGDMILGDAAELAQSLVQASGVGSPAAACARAGGTLRCLFGARLWPNGVIAYVIDNDSYLAHERSAVQHLIDGVAEHYATNTNVRLVARTVERDYVEIRNVTDPRVCGSSQVGRQGGRQILHVHSDADFGCLVHEVAHAFGLEHEQARSDRDEHVRINWANLSTDDLRHNFAIAPTHYFDDYGFYDYDSIMHYPARIAGWSRDATQPVIELLDPAVDPSRLGQRAGLSDGDIFTINQIHPGDPNRVDLRDFQTVGFPLAAVGSTLRNQGGRYTCITFASIAALEAAYKRQGFGDFDLSEEFINYMGKANWLHPNWNQPEDSNGNGTIEDTNGNGIPDEGSIFDKGAAYRENQIGFTGGGGSAAWLKTLATGMYATEESAMPYMPAYVPGVDHTDLPTSDPFWQVSENTNDFNLNPVNFTRFDSPDARKVDRYFSVKSMRTICGWDGAPGCDSALTTTEVETILQQGTEIAIDFFVAGDLDGAIWQYDADIPTGPGHAMLLVGYDKTDPRNPYFIAKNSWGPTSGGVGGDCGEDGYTCISYAYLRYVYAAAYIIEVNPPRDWDKVSFYGRWDLSFDGHHGTLDISHMPGTQDGIFEDWRFDRFPDHRVGTFYDETGTAFRVNGTIAGNRIDFYIDGSTPNLRWDQLSGRHFTYYLFADDGDTMTGFYTDPDLSIYAGYARRTFDGSGFLAEQVSSQDLTPTGFLGHWHVTVGRAPVEEIDLYLQEVNAWTYVDALGREYAQLMGYAQPAGSDVRSDVVALVPLNESARINVTVQDRNGNALRINGKRLSWERDIFAGESNQVPFYAMKVPPTVTFAIASPLDGSSHGRGRERVYFRSATTGFDSEPVVRWVSDRDGLISESNEEVPRTDLSVGRHHITATTAAPDGTPLADSVTITITNDAPTVTILEPTAVAMPFCSDAPISFRAEVYDINDLSYTSVVDANIVWRLNGEIIGTGRSFTRTLPVVTGNLVVSATDSDGAVGTATLAFQSELCINQAPTVQILQPATDSGINNNEFVYDGYDETRGQWYTDVTLRGEATDAEDGLLPEGALLWTTDRADLQTVLLGSGRTLSVRLYANACTGERHEITLTATDSGGKVGSSKRVIVIWTLC